MLTYDRASLVDTIVYLNVIVRAVFLSRRNWSHGASHDVLASLSVYIELFVFYVQFDEGKPCVQVIPAVETPGVYTWICRGLYVAGLKPTVPEHSFTVGPVITKHVIENGLVH